ncbi:MAG: 3-deoxy-7-phosphoheptulonate synthase [Verrucomicrobiaceae bacterium]|nr:MAG: 3-deoxy-7-phosphoheptulonate synthase [Verrucomicrobiaceae bacterium]
MIQTSDLRISGTRPLISPAILEYDLPVPAQHADLISRSRGGISAIFKGQSDRLAVVVGPCSIHDPEAAIEYAWKLKQISDNLEENLLVIMRVYFEKPRTTVGWKGLINDPHLDDTFDINHGLRAARALLLDVAAIGLPSATEFLDTISPQYLADLISWGAIGARTTESQIHRELASGLSMPIGFKNGTGGSIQIALDAIQSASRPHHFLGVTKQGISAIVSTTGNEDCHLILRGGQAGPNYDADSISETAGILATQCFPRYLMVDCSHGNSRKNYRNQPLVARELCGQIAAGSSVISGVMLESNLIEGSQKLSARDEMTRGQSVTDACIGWEATVEVLEDFAAAVRERRKLASKAPAGA